METHPPRGPTKRALGRDVDEVGLKLTQYPPQSTMGQKLQLYFRIERHRESE